MQNLWTDLKENIANKIGAPLHKIEEPEKEGLGDFAFACFDLAKQEKRNPVEIALELSKETYVDGIKEIRAVGPYVNFYIDWSKLAKNILLAKLSKLKANKFLLIEHTSINPNASPHVGRARNAVIGDTLTRILKVQGYKTEVHYFVNDVGKQIALLVWAAGKKKLKFSQLLSTYIEANKKMENDKKVEKEVFSLLKKFEDGNKATMKNFRKIVSTCVAGQKEILSKLNISYDSFDYESNYIIGKSTKEIMKQLEKKNIIFTDEEGRKVMKYGDTHIVLARSDGTSLYPLRDLAYSIDKAKWAKKGLNVLVLGEDQKLYFEQLGHALKGLGIEPPKVVHYSFVLLPGGGKMSTRKGEVVLLEDFMKEAEENALKEVKQRYPKLPAAKQKQRAHSIAVSAVRYELVKSSPDKNITFDLVQAIRFEGDTGPYLQYTYARANSILRKAKTAGKFDSAALKDPREIAVLKLLAKFPSILEKSAADSRPHMIANYTHSLADAFNEFYQNVRVLQAESSKEKAARLALVKATETVLASGLEVLGIEAPKQM